MRGRGSNSEAREKRVLKGEGGRKDEAGESGAPASSAPGLVLVGKFGAPQGVRGQIRVQSFTGDPLAIGKYGPLSDARGVRMFALSDLRVMRENLLVATIVDVTERDAAAALTGVELFARRAALPPPEDDEVYLVDLIGCAAFDDPGAQVGTIIAVENFGAGDILEIAPIAGGETLLIPFTKAFVPTVDISAKRVVIVVPAEDDEPERGA